MLTRVVCQSNENQLREAVAKFLDDMIAPITHCLIDQDPKV